MISSPPLLTQVQLHVAVLRIFVALEDPMCNGRGVASSITLSEDEQGPHGVLGVRGHEGLHKEIGVLSDHDLVFIVVLPIAEADTSGLVYPKHVGVGVPAVGVGLGSGSVRVHAAGAVLREES